MPISSTPSPFRFKLPHQLTSQLSIPLTRRPRFIFPSKYDHAREWASSPIQRSRIDVVEDDASEDDFQEIRVVKRRRVVSARQEEIKSQSESEDDLEDGMRSPNEIPLTPFIRLPKFINSPSDPLPLSLEQQHENVLPPSRLCRKDLIPNGLASFTHSLIASSESFSSLSIPRFDRYDEIIINRVRRLGKNLGWSCITDKDRIVVLLNRVGANNMGINFTGKRSHEVQDNDKILLKGTLKSVFMEGRELWLSKNWAFVS